MRRLLRKREDGAALVEMAIVAPFLLLLLLGVIEFGWIFGQYNALRHGTREGARHAAVDAGGTGDVADIRRVVCEAIEGQGAGITSLGVGVDNGGGAIGDTGTIYVEVSLAGLSNAPLISSFLPSQLTSVATFRLEQDANWVTANPDGADADTYPDPYTTSC